MKNLAFNIEVFAKRLTELMDRHNETIYSLGEFLHLSPPTISKYRNALMVPKIITIDAISEKYNVNLEWLMGQDVEKYAVEKEFKYVPVVGLIAAGQPLLINEQIESYEAVPAKDKADFCLKVKGDSMINARIHDGDIAFIRQQSDVENGEIAAVIVDGEDATLKRVYKYDNTIILRPENTNYQELVFNKKDNKEIKIIGKCIAVKFSLEG